MEGLGTASQLQKASSPICGVAILFGQQPNPLQLSLRLTATTNDLAQTIVYDRQPAAFRQSDSQRGVWTRIGTRHQLVTKTGQFSRVFWLRFAENQGEQKVSTSECKFHTLEVFKNDCNCQERCRNRPWSMQTTFSCPWPQRGAT